MRETFELREDPHTNSPTCDRLSVREEGDRVPSNEWGGCPYEPGLSRPMSIISIAIGGHGSRPSLSWGSNSRGSSQGLLGPSRRGKARLAYSAYRLLQYSSDGRRQLRLTHTIGVNPSGMGYSSALEAPLISPIARLYELADWSYSSVAALLCIE